MSDSTVKKSVVVEGKPERAFRVFTAGIDRWWPRDHHIGTSPMKQLILEPKVGGRWYATCEDGSECDTGTVLAWEPGKRLVVTWQITGEWKYDASFVTELEIRFTPDGDKKTRVDLEHKNIERYGDKAAAIHAQLDHKDGWNGNLQKYARAVAMRTVVMYASSDKVMELAPVHFPAHRARVDVFAARGDLLAIGTFADVRDGSMAVFASREAAEEFVREDPYVLKGVVASYSMKEWNETLLPR